MYDSYWGPQGAAQEQGLARKGVHGKCVDAAGVVKYAARVFGVAQGILRMVYYFTQEEVQLMRMATCVEVSWAQVTPLPPPWQPPAGLAHLVSAAALGLSWLSRAHLLC